MFIIVGDLAQGIHSYRSLNSWAQVLKDILPNANYQALQKNYRTTVEIMNLANDYIVRMIYILISKNFKCQTPDALTLGVCPLFHPEIPLIN
ncbi:hypothetical protein [Neobacillus soli]|uniref:hypothetical protein n=1 Tax=Neobacillus soli TaxID=220688 RepID=UPI000A5A804F|nr:hypothetical protein [Neobacillus soli]